MGSGIKMDFGSEEFIGQGGLKVKKGDVITVDGTAGKVFRGKVEVKQIEVDPKLRRWLTLIPAN